MRSSSLRGLLAGAFACGLGLAAFAPVIAADDASSSESPLKIVRLWTSYRDAQSFIHLGREPRFDDEPGDAIVLRSQPGARDGFYFTVRLRAHPVPDGKLVLHVIAPDGTEPRTFTFPFTSGEKRSILLLAGLTGADWPHGDVMPLAWKLEIVSAVDGAVIATEQSYLWSKP